MGMSVKRPVYAAAAIVAAAGILSAGAAIKPASADATFGVQPNIACSKTTWCREFKNNSTGAGIEGDAANGIGVEATSTAGMAMYGVSSTGDGIVGVSSSNAALVGESSSGIGVYGNGGSGNGVYAYATGSASSFYADGSAIAVEAHGFGSGASVYGRPFGSGPAGIFDASGDTNFGTITYSNGLPAQYAYNFNGNGADVSGTYIGVIGRSSSFPFLATDSSGNDLFWVTGAGQMFAHGYNTFAPTRNGGSATAFGSEAASPTMEDNGTAQLVNGSATIKLDATFAQTIDASKAYQVMLTPDGDTRGLFIASKSPNGFIVREVQGGHSSISFDYHIYAPAVGQSNVRMSLVNRSMINAMGPKAAIVTPARVKTAKPSARPTH
jgi:hypothetical protein